MQLKVPRHVTESTYGGYLWYLKIIFTWILGMCRGSASFSSCVFLGLPAAFWSSGSQLTEWVDIQRCRRRRAWLHRSRLPWSRAWMSKSSHGRWWAHFSGHPSNLETWELWYPMYTWTRYTRTILLHISWRLLYTLLEILRGVQSDSENLTFLW